MKNTKELRAFLVEQMNAVAEGNLDMERAKGVANLSQQIYNTLNIEVKIAVARAKLDGTEIKPVDFADPFGGE